MGAQYNKVHPQHQKNLNSLWSYDRFQSTRKTLLEVTQARRMAWSTAAATGGNMMKPVANLSALAESILRRASRLRIEVRRRGGDTQLEGWISCDITRGNRKQNCASRRRVELRGGGARSIERSREISQEIEIGRESAHQLALCSKVESTVPVVLVSWCHPGAKARGRCSSGNASRCQDGRRRRLEYLLTDGQVRHIFSSLYSSTPRPEPLPAHIDVPFL